MAHLMIDETITNPYRYIKLTQSKLNCLDEHISEAQGNRGKSRFEINKIECILAKMHLHSKRDEKEGGENKKKGISTQPEPNPYRYIKLTQSKLNCLDELISETQGNKGKSRSEINNSTF